MYSSNITYKISFYAVLALLFLLVQNVYSAINIPITVTEAIPDGIASINRQSEPVTVGIPLPENSNITSIDQLGLAGVNIGQFRVLKRYPNNNIWWILIDTQASVNAGGSTSFTLTNGSGNFGGAVLATDSGNTITINTGAAIFTIDKANFNLLDSVIVNDKPLVTTANNGEIAIVVNGTVYSSLYSPATVSIEENGPVRSVIKATGRLTSSGGSTIGGYTLRMHFYKGKSYVRCDTEISNAYHDATGPVYIDEARLRIPLTISGPLGYEFGYNQTSTRGTISSSAWLYQGNYGRYGDRAPDSGIQIGNGGAIIHNLGNSNDYSQGWGMVDNGSSGLAAGIMQMKINEPAGIEFYENGTVDIDLVSKHANSAIVLQGGQHILNIIHLNFFDSRPDSATVWHETQYPLVGRTTLDNYNAAGGIYGISLVSVSDERAFFKEHNHTFPEENIQNTLREGVNRNYTWATSGTPNSDWNLKYLIDFLRTGNGALYLSALQGAIHNGCVATVRSDDFNFFEQYKDFQQSSALWGRIYDEAHTYWEGQPYLYLTTGNEFIKDAIVDFGEWDLEYITHTGYRSYYILSYSRNWSRSYRNMAVLKWILDDDNYENVVDHMTTLLFKTPDKDANHQNGVNYERGYILPAHGISSDFMTSKLFPQALHIVSFCMSKEWKSYERIQDIITGLSYFVYGEFYGSNGDSCGSFGYPYNYDIDSTYSGSYRAKQSEIVLSHAFYNSGDVNYLNRATRLMFGEIDCLWGDTVASELGAHALIYAYNQYKLGQVKEADFINPVGNGRVDIQPSSITYNGNGVYTVTWTVPSDNINRYQIKVSKQPMVENLNFNQQTRTYEYEPALYDNFWAALNIANEPAPLKAGSTQSITIDVSQVISNFNTRYGLTLADSGYISASSQYFFAVKYFSNGSDIDSKPKIMSIGIR